MPSLLTVPTIVIAGVTVDESLYNAACTSLKAQIRDELEELFSGIALEEQVLAQFAIIEPCILEMYDIAVPPL